MKAPPRFSKVLLTAATLAAGSMVILAACKDEIQPPPDALAAFRPDCPYEGSIQFRDSADTETRSYDRLVVPGDLTMVPEYHDCQRFIIPGAAPTYGPLVAIFAADSLGDLFRSMPQSQEAIPVAQILSFDGHYLPLGIRRGHNCLYMWGNPGGYQAYMLPVATQEECSRRRPLGSLPTGATTLQVVVRTKAGFGRPDYPDVARWDRDNLGTQQGIALGCGQAWCEIGPEGFAAVASHEFPAALPPVVRRTVAMKGWYDEQPLAQITANGLGVSSVLGTIYPHPDLGSRVVADYTGNWLEAAYASISAPLQKYKDELNLDAGNVPARAVNRISLCAGNRAACGVPELPPAATTCNNGADPWWARIISVKGDTAYRCVIRRVHPGINIPGAVRWRWAPNDERGWIRCPEGCCEMTGET